MHSLDRYYGVYLRVVLLAAILAHPKAIIQGERVIKTTSINYYIMAYMVCMYLHS